MQLLNRFAASALVRVSLQLITHARMKYLYSFLFVAAFLSANAQLNLSHLSTLPYVDNDNNVRELSDCWGYVDEADNEYALVGVFDGFSLVDVSDPANPNELLYIPGAETIWRDLKTWGDYAYVTNEGDNGLLIVDLSPLPGGPVLQSVNYTGNNFPFTTAHNLYIDENGYCYVFGANYSEGGCIILDLNQNPMAPVEVGVYDEFYIHDGFTRGDTLWFGAINDGFAGLADVSDKANPVTMGTWETPNVFSHNIWPSDNGIYSFTTDEVSGGYIAAYDVTNVTDAEELDRFQSSPGSGVIPHNTHFLDNYLITSYYSDGISIVDVARPHNMIDVGNYDTAPNYSGDGFNGAWGVYPFLPSGNLLVADIEEGLQVLAPQYVRGCYLEGTVTDSVCGIPLSNVTVQIVGSNYPEQTAFDGQYATGIATAGTYDVTFHKPGYQSLTVQGVSLTNGQLTALDVTMYSPQTFALLGSVERQGVGLAGASVLLQNDSLSYSFTTDNAGAFDQCNVVAANYQATITKWGYQSQCINVSLDETNNALDVELELGYYDDFSTHLGWTTGGTAGDGYWTRANPVGTSFGGAASHPENDLDSDCNDKAFTTGNAGGQAGNDDVDDGYVELVSPEMDLTLYADPRVEYYYWFFNDGGNSAPNDFMRVYLTDGTDTVQVHEVDNNDSTSVWTHHSVTVTDFMPKSTEMHLIVRAYDTDPGHLVEAGIDGFSVIDGSGVPISVDEFAGQTQLSVYPNPCNDVLTVALQDATQATVELLDLHGRIVLVPQQMQRGYVQLNTQQLANGVYVLRVSHSGNQHLHKIVKR